MGNLISLPFAALLRWMYSFTGSYGWSIILFALVIKLVILPFQMKSKRNMVRMGRLSGRQQELQKQYANNQQKLQEEQMKLYSEEGINPMASCLPLFIQLPILYGVFEVVYKPITHIIRASKDVIAKAEEITIKHKN